MSLEADGVVEGELIELSSRALAPVDADYYASIAVTIAVIKAGLIVLYFMHVRYSSHLVQFFAGATFFWLAILFVLTLSDYFSRDWPTAPQIEPAAVVGTSAQPTAHGSQ